ncbi:UNVERIFIED_CONTAM: hypothetical protein PYX00_009827 [Menopon gallinae]|uniref:Lipase domain-containing protein n=1 Tax=Menopon gallinae TaxID=328185 RepID=A0AAW2HCY7_9NEOP
MGLLANTLIGCLFALLPGPPGMKFYNAYFQLFPVDKLNSRCPGIRPEKDINFLLYHSASPYKPISLSIGDDEKLESSGIDLSLPTVLYFPPFFEGGDGLSGATIRKAYMKRGGHNFILVDSKRLSAGPWYPAAVTNTYFVGRYAALFIDYLFLQGMPLKNIHLVGMSIGAHAAGVAGHFLKSGRLPRITGLDPASLLFKNKPLELRLDKSDASVVDVIHTDDVFGISTPVGHADFFVNAGVSPQPGCEYGKVAQETKRLIYTIFCSHLRSYKLYAESVLRPTAFPGTSCFSWLGLKFGRCLFGATEFMGMAMSPKAKGIYYVPTGSFPVDNINDIE